MQIDAQILPTPTPAGAAVPRLPVAQAQETARPVQAGNGAEASARHPLQDRPRPAESRVQGRPEGNPESEKGLARSGQRAGGEPELSEAEKQELRRLQARDRELRAQAQAHRAAAGRFVQDHPQLEYQRGPDGRRYAVGGETGLDTTQVPGDPAATLAKARTIQWAALARDNPSGPDRQAAAEAAALEQTAREEIRAAERTQRQVAAAANDAFNPDAGGRRVAPAAPAPVGQILDVFA
jgi:hypothetical protein